jgi:hypothetical protein
MMPTTVNEQAPVPPPAYHRAQARLGLALHIDALTDGSPRCICSHCVVWQCAWPVGAALPHCLQALEECLEHTARSLCCSSRFCARCGDSPDLGYARLVTRLACFSPGVWLAAGERWLPPHSLPLEASQAREVRRGSVAGSALHPQRLDCHPLSAHWRSRSSLSIALRFWLGGGPTLMRPDASCACATSPSALTRLSGPYPDAGAGSGLPLFFLLSPANSHDAPFACPLLTWAVRLYQIHPRFIRLDAAYWGLRLIAWIHATLGAVAVIRLPSQATEEPFLLASYMDQGGIGQTQWH